MKTYLLDNSVLDAYHRAEAERIERLRKAKRLERILWFAFLTGMALFMAIVIKFGIIN